MSERQFRQTPERRAQIRRQTRQRARFLLILFLVGVIPYLGYRAVLRPRIWRIRRAGQ